MLVINITFLKNRSLKEKKMIKFIEALITMHNITSSVIQHRVMLLAIV